MNSWEQTCGSSPITPRGYVPNQMVLVGQGLGLPAAKQLWETLILRGWLQFQVRVPLFSTTHQTPNNQKKAAQLGVKTTPVLGPKRKRSLVFTSAPPPSPAPAHVRAKSVATWQFRRRFAGRALGFLARAAREMRRPERVALFAVWVPCGWAVKLSKTWPNRLDF